MKKITENSIDELYIRELSGFDVGSYCMKIFNEFDNERFKKVATSYENKYGYGSYYYMQNTKESWKNRSTRMRYSTRNQIISSTASTLNSEEKLKEAMCHIARQIKFQKIDKIKTSEIDQTFINIINIINNFELRKHSEYCSSIYSGKQLIEYQEYAKYLFVYYTIYIYKNLKQDLQKVEMLKESINTSFMKINYYTFLFEIEIVTDKSKNINNDSNLFNHKFNSPIRKLIEERIANHSFEDLINMLNRNEKLKLNTDILNTEIIYLKNTIDNLKHSGQIINFKSIMDASAGRIKIDLKVAPKKYKQKLILASIIYVLTCFLVFYVVFDSKENVIIFATIILAMSAMFVTITKDIFSILKDFLNFMIHGRK